MDIWVLSSLGLSLAELLWILLYKSFYGHVFPSLLDQYQGTEWQDYVRDMCLAF